MRCATFKIPVWCLMFLLGTTTLFAQDTIPKVRHSYVKRFEIGLSVSPNYADVILRNKDGSSEADWMIETRSESETAKLGMSAGLHFGCLVAPRVGIETGVLYTNNGYHTKKLELVNGNIVDPRYGFVYGTGNGNSATKEIRFIHNFHYVGIPIEANIRFGGHVWTIIPSLGFVTEFLVKSTVTKVRFSEDGTQTRSIEESDLDFKRVNISPTASLGIEYCFRHNMCFRAEPSFRIGTLPIIDAPVTGYLYNVGLQFSYYFRFIDYSSGK